MNPKPITKPLLVPRTTVRIVKHHSMCSSRWDALTFLASLVNVRRPGHGETPRRPSDGALLEALATGRVGVVRMDDPERRVFVARPVSGRNGMEGKNGNAEGSNAEHRTLSGDPRCPGEWDD